MNLPRTYQEEQWIKGGRRPEYKKFIGKPVVSWTQVEGWTAKRGFNTRTSPGRKEYIRKYFLGEEFKDKGWREFGTDVEDYITTRNEEAAQKFTIDEVSTLDQIEPLGVFQDEIVIDFGSFCLLGYIDDYTPPDHNNRVRVLRDYKTKSENSKKDLHQKDKFQLELYILGLQQRGLHIERAEYLIIERLGGRDCMNGKGRNSLSVGSNIWKEEYHFDQASIDRAQSVVKKVAQEISDYYTLFKQINVRIDDKGLLQKEDKQVGSSQSGSKTEIQDPVDLIKIMNGIAKAERKRGKDFRSHSQNEDFFALEERLEILAQNDQVDNISAPLEYFSKDELSVLGLPLGGFRISDILEINTSRNSNLKILPSNIGLFEYLETLILKEQNLRDVPIEIGRLANLLKLDLSKNHLTDFPDEFSQLTSLEVLDVRGNYLTKNVIQKLRTWFPNCNIKADQSERTINHIFSEKEIMLFDLTDGLEIKNVTVLKCFEKDIVTLPSNLAQLYNLEELILWDNNLDTFPIGISELTNLKRLEIVDNNLDSFPTEIGQLEKLKHLDLSGNDFKDITDELGNLCKLQTLSLTHNNLTEIPLKLEVLKNLTYLDLSYNKFESPDNLSKILRSLPNLTHLNLEYNDYHIPSLLSNAADTILGHSLEKLSLNRSFYYKQVLIDFSTVLKLENVLPHCEFEGDIVFERLFAQDVFNKIELTFFNLAPDAPLSEINTVKCNYDFREPNRLPLEIFDLANLNVLDLTDFDLSDIPLGNIRRLLNIYELSLQSCHLEKIPPEIGGLVSLEKLDLSSNCLESIPPGIGRLSYLENLDLGTNTLESIPPDIGNLVNLKKLDLSFNSLESIPPAIGNLVNLEKLDLYSNSLESVPLEIQYLVNLLELNLGGNSLANFPPQKEGISWKSFFTYWALEKLDLSRNNLKSIPSEIGDLVNLEKLDLSSNSLESIPPEIGNLTALIELDISGNYIEELPLEFLKLKQLKVLKMKNLEIDNIEDIVDILKRSLPNCEIIHD